MCASATQNNITNVGRILPAPRGQVHGSGRLQLKAHAMGIKKHCASRQNTEKYIRNNNLNILSIGTPTYWPTDLNKKPDLLDFAVTRGLNTNKLKITPNLELSSDHTPIIMQ